MVTQETSVDHFYVVGIGASAGGLAAFEAFFSGIPKKNLPNMAFVLVQHLAPDHKSILNEIIKRYTDLPVFEVEDGMVIKNNSVYIIPPNKNMAVINGTLELLDITLPKGQNMPIDFFFRSLAVDQKEKAVCIVLSGTGSDGSLGLKDIKSEGGLAIVQTQDSSEYDGMPSSALATGVVDLQLSPKMMFQQLVEYEKHSSRLLNYHGEMTDVDGEHLLKKIFVLIRNQTGHDFSNYKPSMIGRRIERRLAINKIDNLLEYIKFLQQTPSEIDILLNDMLIGVTHFFRDKEAFAKLEEDVIPKIFEGKPSNSTIRIWCAGCSTGEEAYSIAILFYEYLEKCHKSFNIQIFATDMDQKAISIARVGMYSSHIKADLTEERLEKYFSLDLANDSYRIIKPIREMLIFSEQSIIKDPPFSKLDLISCRNLMIYLNGELQKKLIPLFHYALSPGGVLFLGASETVGSFELLFEVVDRKLKIYRRKEDIQGSLKCIPSQIFTATIEKDTVLSSLVPKGDAGPKQSLREISEQMILKETPISGVLINENGDTLYIHGRTGLYLEPSQGEVGINNVIKMAREGLKHEIKVALKNCIEKNETIRTQDISIKTNGHYTKVNLTIKPVKTNLNVTQKQSLYMIFLEESMEVTNQNKKERVNIPQTIAMDTYIEELKAELRIKDEYLQSANEELETSNEELKSTIEEMQSVNEELQSTNEELETSKEELQSINEELSTVNAELQIKVHDLSQISNDMNNLLSGTNIATIFLDHHQNILRFTPTASKIINLIMSDVGRPVAHIASNLVNYNQLTEDVKTVLDTLILKNIEVQTLEGSWYDMIIQPYRTIENVIEGVVITFVNISEAKKAKERLEISELRYRSLFETTQVGKK